MLDIGFFMRAHGLKKKLMAGGFKGADKRDLFDQLEKLRSEEPVVYNIETTNACNMRCEMCPRTTMMTRSVQSLDKMTFIDIVGQLRPASAGLWGEWEDFVRREYGIPRDAVSENHFFLYIIPKVIQLHGYGDPLLDKNMPEYVKLLSERGFHSYFSCNPANIDIERTRRMFQNGLSYIKYSIETVDDVLHKRIRGKASDFTESYKKILGLLESKKSEGYTTTVIITMLNLNRKDQKEDFQRLRDAFAEKDVYLYLKSEDQQWYRKDYHGTDSVHWSEICQHPWLSMTIKSNGEAAMCMEDFNNEIVLGDARKERLRGIWNGEKYRKFRWDHLSLTKGLKCVKACDMKLVGNFL
ncbi:MAG: radical SAM protein [Elusimicrobiota bacterium]